MSEPSSGVPSEIADADVQAPETQTDQPDQVTLHLDEDKLEAWDEVKSDYQVDPDGQPSPNSMETSSTSEELEGAGGGLAGDDDEGETPETSAIPG